MSNVSVRTRGRPLPRMGRVQRKRWTRAEYHRLLDVGVLDEGAPFELIEGEIIAKLTVNQPHVIACRRTARLLASVFGEEFVQAQAPIALNESTEPEPDIYVLNRPVEDFVGDSPSAESVTLIVEVSDTSLRRDLGFKAVIYARAGIAEYWSLNLSARTLIVHRNPMPAGYDLIETLSEMGEITPPVASGRAIAVLEMLPPRSAI